MEMLPRNKLIARVKGHPDDLNRAILKEQFQKFGKVTKIFVDLEIGIAKVYLDSEQSVKEACAALTGFRNWDCSYSKDSWEPKVEAPSYKRDTKPHSDIYSAPESVKGNMEETCLSAGDYVDINGRNVEVLQAENGQLFVSYDDIRASGFNLYPRDIYANTLILKGEDLRHFEIYLLNQGQKYILDYKKSFNEEEIINVFQRVKEKLMKSPSESSGTDLTQGRLISNTSTKNFSITAPNDLGSANGREGSRPPRQLTENFQPTFSFRNAKPHQEVRTNQGLSNGCERRGERAPLPQNSRNFEENSFSRGRGGGGRGGGGRGDRRQDNSLWEKRDDNMQPRKPRSHHDFPTHHNQSTHEIKQETDEKWEEESIEPKAKPESIEPNVKLELFEPTAKSEINRMPPINIKRIQLPIGSIQTVKISYFRPDKGVFSAQSLDSEDLLQEILLHVNTVDNVLPEIAEPKRDMLCCVFYEDCWYRGVVLNHRQTPGQTLVELIDYGNRETIKTPVRELSDKMKAIPGQAIRCAPHRQEEPNWSIDQVLEVFVKKHVKEPEYDDSTHIMEIRRVLEAEEEEVAAVQSQPSLESELKKVQIKEDKEECFMKVPPTNAKIDAGSTVQIVNYTESKLILRNKETALVCKDVYAHIATMAKTPITSPVVGQICLCCKDGDEGLHRAVIKKITGQTAELEYLEYNGTETLALKSLKHVDAYLANLPRAFVEQPYAALKTVNEEAVNFLVDLIVEKKKLKTVSQGDTMDFQLADGPLLSEKIKSLVTPLPPVATAPPVVETPKPAKVAPVTTPSTAASDEYATVTFDEMPYHQPPLGTGHFTCYACKGDSLTLVSLCEENIPHLTELFGIEEPKDKTPWAPEEFQMCLAKFDGAWSRGLVTEIKEDKFEVLFVDFGNSEDIPKADIRRFPKSLAAIPILGLGASFDGIPDTPAVKDKLKELCADDTECEANLKKYVEDEMKYLIEIPSVYEQLRKEGLM